MNINLNGPQMLGILGLVLLANMVVTCVVTFYAHLPTGWTEALASGITVYVLADEFAGRVRK